MDYNVEEKSQNINKELKCKDCGALLLYAPGTQKLACKYCGAQNDITAGEKESIEEIAYQDFISNKINQVEKQTISTVTCNNCGATTTLKPNLTSDNCAFCASPLVIQGGTTSTIIKPKYLLPFKIDDKNAHDIFIKWLNGLWFAPNDLKKYATLNEKLKGIYMPYWTYDTSARTDYEGERGEHYYEGSGKNRVRKTRWYDTNGTVQNSFDDVCVLASKSLPDSVTRPLEPWDLNNLTPYNEGYISGFQTECYQTDVQKGFEMAKEVMEDAIKVTIRQQIGGDEQRINRMHVVYSNVSFKHILLPVWLSAYSYNNKVFRFIINGRTGEVQGQRPYSAIKIALAVMAALMVFGIIYALSQN